MKYSRLLKPCVGLLVIASASAPLASMAANWSYAEGALYDNLRNEQSELRTMDSQRGAQGPIRMEKSGPDLSYAEGALYDNLRKMQAAQGTINYQQHGAQGPIRTDSMEATWSYSEGALYDNLRKLQITF